MPTELIIADYQNPDHARDLGFLLAAYAQDEAINGKPLPPEIPASLASKLAEIPHALSLLCYVDGKPAAFANCFFGFSTFKCQPLLNIHDIAVHPDFRRRGLSKLLLAEIETIAREKSCCKVTLEVLSHNEPAKAAYLQAGFSSYDLDPITDQTLFWEKPL